MKTHKCSVPDCDRQTLIHMLMCQQHWAKVPHQVRKDVWRTYRAWKKIDGGPSDEYWKAVRVAIESVQKEKEQAQLL